MAATTFSARASDGHGYVRVSSKDPHYFEFDDGTPYFAIGENNRSSFCFILADAAGAAVLKLARLRPSTLLQVVISKGSCAAVGTTVVRALESAGRSGRVEAGRGATSLFIRPGFEFKIVDRLLTNFHLPKSTLLMLVSAFAGYDHIRAAYAHAVAGRYRFFSYGDAMLLERSDAV